MELSPDRRMISERQTGVKRVLYNVFRRGAFYSDFVEAVQKCLAKPQSVDVDVSRMIDVPAFTVSVARPITYEVEKGSPNKANTVERFSKLAEAVGEKNIKTEDGMPRKNMDSVRSRGQLTDISNAKKTNLNM